MVRHFTWKNKGKGDGNELHFPIFCPLGAGLTQTIYLLASHLIWTTVIASMKTKRLMILGVVFLTRCSISSLLLKIKCFSSLNSLENTIWIFKK
jgi:hypothetical protein